MIYLSSDWVYHRDSYGNHSEREAATGYAAYGRSKVRGEAQLAALLPDRHLILRSSLIYGPPSPWKPELRSCLGWLISAYAERKEVSVFNDEYRTPVYIQSLIETIIAALRLFGGQASFSQTLPGRLPGESLVVNVAGGERLSRYEMARILFDVLDDMRPEALKSKDLVRAISRKKAGGPPRPIDLSLRTDRMNKWLGCSPLRMREAVVSLLHVMQARNELDFFVSELINND